jgi:2-polyprenyl-6-methoxyphenol hydroxylase-like FAD-dependent oxidoreductase
MSAPVVDCNPLQADESSLDEERTSVTHLIVGFGFAGIRLMERLSEQGLDVMVIEKRATYVQAGYALHMGPQQAKKFPNIPMPPVHHIHIENGRRGPPTGVHVVERSAWVEGMVKQLESKNPTWRDCVRFGFRVEKVIMEQDGQGGLVVAEERYTKRLLQVRFGSLYACDGANSVVREKLFTSTTEPSFVSLRMLVRYPYYSDKSQPQPEADHRVFFGHDSYGVINTAGAEDGDLNFSLHSSGPACRALAKRAGELAKTAKNSEESKAIITWLMRELDINSDFVDELQQTMILNLKAFDDNITTVSMDERYEKAMASRIYLLGDAINQPGAVTGLSGNIAICDADACAELVDYGDPSKWRDRQRKVLAIKGRTWFRRTMMRLPMFPRPFRWLGIFTRFVATVPIGSIAMVVKYCLRERLA